MPASPAAVSTDRVSLTAFVFSLVGMGIVAIPLAIWGMVRTAHNGRRGRGFAIAALAFSAAWAVAVSALVLASGLLAGGGQAAVSKVSGPLPTASDTASSPSSATTSASTPTAVPKARGPLIKPRRIYWEDLKPAMCVRLPQGTGVLYLTVVDCRAAHQEEVMSRSTLSGGRKWPGDDAVNAASEVKCRAAFASYVGIGFDDSKLEMDSFTTDAAGWADGDHTVVCLVLDPGNEHLTRTLRGAHQ